MKKQILDYINAHKQTISVKEIMVNFPDIEEHEVRNILYELEQDGVVHSKAVHTYVPGHWHSEIHYFWK